MTEPVTTQGSKIIREGRHLLVKKGEDTYHTLFVEKIRQLVLFGNVALTPSARNVLLNHNVDTVFCRKDGRYVGRFANPSPKNVFLRKQQFSLLDDDDFAVNFCRSIVKEKLSNMVTLLMRISRTRQNKLPRQKAKEIKALYPKDDFIIEEPAKPQEIVPKKPGPDVTADRYGLLADLDCTETFDLPPQRMAETPDEEEMEKQAGKLPVKLKPKAFARDRG